jgi:hypothetical protein
MLYFLARPMNQKKADQSRGSARDALVNLVFSLHNISERQNLHRPDSQQDVPENESVTEIRARMRCGICRQSVEPGNFLVPLKCCGAVAHVACLAKAPVETPPCPNCGARLKPDQVRICQKVSEQIPSLAFVI